MSQCLGPIVGMGLGLLVAGEPLRALRITVSLARSSS
jgi:hypothetical protein